MAPGGGGILQKEKRERRETEIASYQRHSGSEDRKAGKTMSIEL